MSKRIAMSAALAAVFTSFGVQAADMGVSPLRGPSVIAAPSLHAPAYDWTGFYVGGQAGGMNMHNRGTVTTESRLLGSQVDANGAPLAGEVAGVYDRYKYDFSRTGLTYGLFAGYMHQFGSTVIGVEADINGPMSRMSSGRYFENPELAVGPGGVPGFGNDGAVQRITSNWDGSLRARIGFVKHATLFYMTGGVAVGNFKSCSVYGSDAGCDFAGQYHQVRYTTTRIGYTIGAGVEHRFAKNWSLRAEYRYTSYAAVSCAYNASCAVTNPEPGVTGSRAGDINNRLDTHALRVGLTYWFAGPTAEAVSPVTARY